VASSFISWNMKSDGNWQKPQIKDNAELHLSNGLLNKRLATG